MGGSPPSVPSVQIEEEPPALAGGGTGSRAGGYLLYLGVSLPLSLSPWGSTDSEFLSQPLTRCEPGEGRQGVGGLLNLVLSV